jgi:DNA invertase Pin-like site-specific DNA recombinase
VRSISDGVDPPHPGDRPHQHERTYKGRPPTIQPDAVRRLKEDEKLGASEIAQRLGIGRASVYRVLKEATA